MKTIYIQELGFLSLSNIIQKITNAMLIRVLLICAMLCFLGKGDGISGSIAALLRNAESQYLIFKGFYTLRSGFDYFIAGKKSDE